MIQGAMHYTIHSKEGDTILHQVGLHPIPTHMPLYKPHTLSFSSPTCLCQNLLHLSVCQTCTRVCTPHVPLPPCGAPWSHFPVIHTTKDNQLVSANTSLRKAPQEGVSCGSWWEMEKGLRRGCFPREIGEEDTASAEGQPHVAVAFLLRHGCS